jgi:fructokinase
VGADELYRKIADVKGDFDILCIGELLTDYLSKEDKPLKEVTLFEKFLGGSPANIVVHFQNLEMHPALITKIGNDDDGRFLLSALKKFSLTAADIKISEDEQTTKSLIGRQKNIGESPESKIIRGADTNLKRDDIDMSLVKRSKIIHTNAFSLAEEPTRSTILQVLDAAHKLGKIISFDPNFREHVWPNRKEALNVLRKAYAAVDLTKPSLDDATSLFGLLEPEQFIEKFHELGAKTVILTMGSKGSIISDGVDIITIPAEQCEAVDATGAGDLYWSVFLKCLLEGRTLKTSGKIASYAATKAVKTRGAILEKAEYEQILAYMQMFE